MGGELRVRGTTVTPPATAGPRHDAGSCVIVVAVDFPCAPHELARFARRGVFGLGRVGAAFSHGSGDFALSFGTDPAAGPPLRPVELDAVFAAILECVEERVVDALVAARTVTLRSGRTAPAVSHAALRQAAAP